MSYLYTQSGVFKPFVPMNSVVWLLYVYVRSVCTVSSKGQSLNLSPPIATISDKIYLG